MIEALLPDGVAWAEAFADRSDEPVFPGEEEAVGSAVDERRREFVTARRCAREALSQLGVAARPIVVGPHREPIWPAGVLGSITHCTGYRAAVVAAADRLSALGIDAEPDAPLPEGVLGLVARPEELRGLSRSAVDAARSPCLDRLLLCAKETLFKAWFPLTGTRLDFPDVTVSLGPGTFDAQLVHGGPAGFTGRWLVQDGLLLAVVTLDKDAGRRGPC